MANSCNSGDKFDDLQMLVIDNDFEPWNPFRSLLVKIIVSLNKAQGEINTLPEELSSFFAMVSIYPWTLCRQLFCWTDHLKILVLSCKAKLKFQCSTKGSRYLTTLEKWRIFSAESSAKGVPKSATSSNCTPFCCKQTRMNWINVIGSNGWRGICIPQGTVFAGFWLVRNCNSLISNNVLNSFNGYEYFDV